MSELRLERVGISFDDVAVLAEVTLTVGDGEIVALLGPSGSGKSTLLRIVAGIERPDHGMVWLGGVDITDVAIHRRDIGMVFQDNQLFPHRNVLDNAAFGLKMQGVGRHERDRRAREWLGRVGLDGFDRRRVTDLSGGEAKRVALARTMVARPRLVLLDEPLTGLDRELHDRLAGELAELLRSTGTTSLLVTHDHDEAAVIADRVVTMDELNGTG